MPPMPGTRDVRTVGVIGNGVVGGATARVWMEHYDVRVWDVIPEKCTHTLDVVTSCDVLFLCLPTPQKESSYSPDTSALEDTLNMLAGSRPEGTYLIRSTVPVGFTRQMAVQYRLPNLIHNPEFLTARCAVADAMTPTRNIIGYTSELINPGRVERVKKMYEGRFPGIPTMVMDSNESELVKLAQNAFFAVKVGFFNEIHELAAAHGMNWEAVRAAILADGRIAHSHTQVPGPDGKYGFGGACLPKDLANFVSCLRAAACDDRISQAAIARNLHDRLHKE